MTPRTVTSALIVGLLTVTFTPSAAFAKDVEVFISKHANFPAYRTFKWDRNAANTRYGLVDDEPKYGPPVRRAVTDSLIKKGMTETTENPDLLIRTLLLDSVSPQLEGIIYSYAGPMTDWSVGPARLNVGRYNKAGTLIVNVVDAKTEKSAWLGLVVKATGKPDKLDSYVRSATEKLFEKYPGETK